MPTVGTSFPPVPQSPEAAFAQPMAPWAAYPAAARAVGLARPATMSRYPSAAQAVYGPSALFGPGYALVRGSVADKAALGDLADMGLVAVGTLAVAVLAGFVAGGFLAGRAMAPSKDERFKYGVAGGLGTLIFGPLGLGGVAAYSVYEQQKGG